MPKWPIKISQRQKKLVNNLFWSLVAFMFRSKYWIYVYFCK